MTRRSFAHRPTIKIIMPRTGSESCLSKNDVCTENSHILKTHRKKWYENNKEWLTNSKRAYVKNNKEHVRN